ncbi:hypothetical protein Mpe_B0353 (plasmid) [Methylibium petroleiphilum PM1]|uniref:Uncharacterized protein n=1 Tax=Methylibium petroleiphilum (strain ATCC BAA-1232 / LMG 22953 / PM1) TaxID=420662 RepID=A2SNI9_METPP|nr:hypothetical protein Mpe_B0353 [Methylibium petroleiphilum PM1]
MEVSLAAYLGRPRSNSSRSLQSLHRNSCTPKTCSQVESLLRAGRRVTWPSTHTSTPFPADSSAIRRAASIESDVAIATGTKRTAPMIGARAIAIVRSMGVPACLHGQIRALYRSDTATC